MKFILALLLSVNLLACPLRCGSCNANAAEDESAAVESAGCCENCCNPSDSPSSDTSSPCDGDDCNCQNCICEGAVLEAGAEVPVTPILWSAWVHLDVRLGATTILVQQQVHSQPLCSRFYDGRTARIGLQSLLI